MTLNILNTAAGMLLLMAIGFLCSKVGIIDRTGEKLLTTLLLQVVQPVFIVMAYQRAFDRGMLRDFWICMAMAAGAFLVMILLPYLFFRKGSRDRESTFSRKSSLGVGIGSGSATFAPFTV